MAIGLVVTEPFHHEGVRYHKGALISDPETVEMAQTLFSTHVIRRAVPDFPVAPIEGAEPEDTASASLTSKSDPGA